MSILIVCAHKAVYFCILITRDFLSSTRRRDRITHVILFKLRVQGKIKEQRCEKNNLLAPESQAGTSELITAVVRSCCRASIALISITNYRHDHLYTCICPYQLLLTIAVSVGCHSAILYGPSASPGPFPEWIVLKALTEPVPSTDPHNPITGDLGS